LLEAQQRMNALDIFPRRYFYPSLNTLPYVQAGAMEVSENGDIANWKIPGHMVKGMGGAMDLVSSAENIIVAMMHANKAGESKLLKRCSLPLTGVGCVKKIITNLAVIEVTHKGFKLLERAPGISVETIKKATEGSLIIEGDIPEMVI